MTEGLCPFGAFFRQRREAKKISLWRLGLTLQYHLRNLQRIEAGQHEPGLLLALRMVAAISEAPGEFFLALADHEGLLDLAPSTDKKFKPIQEIPLPLEGEKTGFGSLLKYARLKHGLSQRDLVEASGYNLRNLSNLENGRQIPGVMSALKLSCASGCDLVWFYSVLVHLVHIPGFEGAEPLARHDV